MVQQLSKTEVIYPDSDGQPMSDNTLQFNWIVTIKENLETLYADDPNVFVAGDLLWYPVEGDNKTRQAPDAMVVFGAEKGYRGSYMQWKENNIAPQVVFEVLSPGNRLSEMAKKFQFYQKYGVQEYYVYDPYDIELMGWQKREYALEVIEGIQDWRSPLLNIRLVVKPDTLEIYHPSGERFINLTEATLERDKAKKERDVATQERDAAIARAAQLEAQLKALGIEPNNS